MDSILEKIDALTVLRLQPGDVLVVKIAQGYPPPAEVERIKKYFAEACPSNVIRVVDSRISFDVIRGGE